MLRLGGTGAEQEPPAAATPGLGRARAWQQDGTAGSPLRPPDGMARHGTAWHSTARHTVSQIFSPPNPISLSGPPASPTSSGKGNVGGPHRRLRAAVTFPATHAQAIASRRDFLALRAPHK